MKVVARVGESFNFMKMTFHNETTGQPFANGTAYLCTKGTRAKTGMTVQLDGTGSTKAITRDMIRNFDIYVNMETAANGG